MLLEKHQPLTREHSHCSKITTSKETVPETNKSKKLERITTKKVNTHTHINVRLISLLDLNRTPRS